MNLSESERWLAITALNTSAERWREWSTTIANEQVAAQFAKQAEEANVLSLKLASYEDED